MRRSPSGIPRALPAIVLMLLAVIAVIPLIAHGCSCGHDFEFHLQSWLDAAAQMRHGTLDPSWTVSAAWNAGEPRFIFYPPLSWIFGALLALAMPLSAAPVVFTFVALLGAGATMYLLARDYVSVVVALLASAVYIASPYMLFTAYERTAYGELLAAIWIPLLLRAGLRETPRITAIAFPTALLWLTNAPAAVMGMYTLLLIGGVRVAVAIVSAYQASKIVKELVLRFTAGGALGLALAAFYLIPAAYERRYVQVAMAIIPNMRIEDNFLFGHTGDVPHDGVLHSASLIAVAMLAIMFTALLAAFAQSQRGDQAAKVPAATKPLPVLVALATATAFLLTPVSVGVWHHLPELAFLQFPWRLLSVLGAALALAVALVFRWIRGTRTAVALTSFAILVFVGTMTTTDIRAFRQPCEALDYPSVRAQLFASHHGVEPTDEYTPTEADNDVLRWDDPGYWLASNSGAFAPGTVPNPAATVVNYDSPAPVEQTISGVAPRHLQLNLAAPADLILNLRDYPAWQVLRNGSLVTHHLQRDDGLLAIALPAGESTIDVRWHRTCDQVLGDIMSILALIVLGVLMVRSRTIKPDA